MKGVYYLEIQLNKNTLIKVGKLGELNFKKGIYYYVGSGMNNVIKRINRHKSDNKKSHWHIDYFLLNKNTKIINYKILLTNVKKNECLLANFISTKLKSINKFGSSDCKCSSHLFYKIMK